MIQANDDGSWMPRSVGRLSNAVLVTPIADRSSVDPAVPPLPRPVAAESARQRAAPVAEPVLVLPAQNAIQMMEYLAVNRESSNVLGAVSCIFPTLL